MGIQLPDPIDSFVRAENAGDADAISNCFAPYATVRADEEYFEGRPAIKAWKAASQDQSITPLAFAALDSEVTLKARLSGKFIGSPVTAEFHFVLVNNQIASLQIRNQPVLTLNA